MSSSITGRSSIALHEWRQRCWRVGAGAMGLLALAAAAHAARTDVPRRADQASAGEVVELRTVTSRTVALPNGEFQASISIEPQNVRDASGSFVPVNTAITKTDKADARGYSLAVDGTYLPTRFAADGPRAMSLSQMGEIVQTPTTLRFNDGRNIDVLGDVSPSGAQASGNRVTYPDAFPAADFVYIAREGGLAKELVLRERPRDPAPGLDAATTWLELGETLELPAGASLVSAEGAAIKTGFETGGSLRIVSGGSRPIKVAAALAFESPEMAPDAHTPFPAQPGTFRTEVAADGTITLWTRIPWSWLGAADRPYPVVIDPTLDSQPDEGASKDHLIWEGVDPNYTGGDTVPALIWGSNTSGPSHGLVQFNLSSIPAGSTITSATLDLGPWAGLPGSTGNYQILENTGAWTEGAVSWNTRPPVNATPVDVQLHNAGTHQVYNVTSSVAAMVAGSLPNNGWRVAPSPTGSDHTASMVQANDGNPADRPHLIVDYTTSGGGTTGGGCDLTPVLANIARLETKLDDGTRFTSDAERNAQTSTLQNQIINSQNTIINNYTPRLVALESKLDDGTRFTSDAERTNLQNALVTEINANETKIDRLEVKLDTESRFTDDGEFDVGLQAIAALEAKADEQAADADYQQQVEIEHALGEDNNVNKPMILYMLPAAGGGHLEEVRDLVDLRITQAEANGCSTGGARTDWNSGNAQYALGHWELAYGKYASAYKTASMGPCNP